MAQRHPLFLPFSRPHPKAVRDGEKNVEKRFKNSFKEKEVDTGATL